MKHTNSRGRALRAAPGPRVMTRAEHIKLEFGHLKPGQLRDLLEVRLQAINETLDDLARAQNVRLSDLQLEVVVAKTSDHWYDRTTCDDVGCPCQEVLHPFCNNCGWRKGGKDSWDGNACKCGHSEPPIGAAL